MGLGCMNLQPRHFLLQNICACKPYHLRNLLQSNHPIPKNETNSCLFHKNNVPLQEK